LVSGILPAYTGPCFDNSGRTSFEQFFYPSEEGSLDDLSHMFALYFVVGSRYRTAQRYTRGIGDQWFAVSLSKQHVVQRASKFLRHNYCHGPWILCGWLHFGEVEIKVCGMINSLQVEWSKKVPYMVL
jgi:hypothetical protein